MGRHKDPPLPEALVRFGRKLKRYPIDAGTRVYFLLHQGELVYVGQTKHLTKRLMNHFREKVFDAVYYIDVSEEHADDVEREVIWFSRPKYNTHRPPPKGHQLKGGGWEWADVSARYDAPPRKKPQRQPPEPTMDELRAAISCLMPQNYEDIATLETGGES